MIGTVRRLWQRVLHRWHYSFVGVTGAVVLFCLSLTPSLLPRGNLLQGLISGISAAIGYGIGVLAVWMLRNIVVRPLPRPGPVAWRWLAGIAATTVTIFLYLGAGWQAEVYRLAGVDRPAGYGFPTVLLVAVLTAAGVVGLFRLLRSAAARIAAFGGRWIRPAAARVIAGALVAVIALGVLNGVVINGFFAVTDNAFRSINNETQPGTEPPADALRSGGPGSLMPWASLGNQGRRFVADGPSAQQLQQFAGQAAMRPIRVYAGLASAPTSRERAALAVRELERTGAFDRKVLCVITTTGTGWVDEKSVAPLEYMYNGDTAMVGLQYSYLPSWLSFLVDEQRAHEAGRDLFNQVYGAWSRLPSSHRPKLVVFGESLGAFGAESAFSGVDDIRNRVDGMVLVGPPNSSALWQQIVDERDAGSPEVLPIYEQGATVRFAGDPASDLDHPANAWNNPRVVYLQHASDPIVWWSLRLIVSRPEWLAEPRGRDVSPKVRWIPFVTFWQVTADMAFSTGVPAGHGHNYGPSAVPAWADVVPPQGWTPDRTAELTPIIASGGG
ncbi:alpha/beta hydrolase [Dactylosporangium cerinum]|uniref:Alpha/beta hydrolase n=1 Tax=Dactylosporangium cerinum TaxID=1434730 RepID=A0ABV9WJ27_9ACTN